ncbi:hypothetical protein BZA77DRAFT_348435 [Pyronema omphalodes]|nr:hypothetical protein BZA77DRAFT_348435 [Pyronema omphalodes]
MNPAFLFKLFLIPLTAACLLPDGSSRCLVNDMSHVEVYLGDTYNSNTLRIGNLMTRNQCYDLIRTPMMTPMIPPRIPYPPPPCEKIRCDSFADQPLQPFPDSTWIKAYKIVPGTPRFGKFGDKPVCCFFYDKEGCKAPNMLFGAFEQNPRGTVIEIPKGDVTRGETDRTKVRSWKCVANCASPADAWKAEVAKFYSQL